MTPRIYLLLYIFATIIISAQSSVFLLLIVTLVLFAVAGKESLKLSKKAFLLVAIFTLSISLTYSALLYYQGGSFVEYFLMVNLRSFDLMFLTLLFSSRVNIFDAVSFSKDLSFLLVMSVSKIMTTQRVFIEYTMALKSRTLRKPTLTQSYEFLGSAIAGFLDRSIR